ncbi:hypothetical protein [Thiothrix fructosivorans]|jgi:hypothetical protein|uniref:Uncharacterized protein n=1 Tax=Thiothrix fructosivorans TaxID=111770 RepID=A0A8B0SJC7_9GAMM|nr:hypothetical protein [Thiothrix fructosivorans]MBO0611784.1 hypothetical protein [Thiothrix fructosivorans]QTX10560.1 hypothetical protein J1836_018645 [Thiothrix fructosivorans]
MSNGTDEAELLTGKALLLAEFYGLSYPARLVMGASIPSYYGAFIIDVPESLAQVIISKDLVGSDSIAVIESRSISRNDIDDDDFVGMLRWVALYIRQSTTNTWFRITLMAKSGMLLEKYQKNLDGDDDGEYEESDADSDNSEYEAKRLAAIVASAAGYGDLRNNEQRHLFLRDMCKNGGYWENWDAYSGRILTYADYIYEHGVLHPLCKRLQEEGMTISAIAKKIGKSKGKVEKALALVPSDFVFECLQLASDTTND